MKEIRITKLRVLVFLLLFLVIAVIAVYIFQMITRNTMKEDLFVTNHSCSLPCWNNITPGLTKSKVAIDILQEIAYIDKDSIQQSGIDVLGGCIWNWTVPGRRITSGLSWQDGVVREIKLDLAFGLSVDEILEMFGDPEAFSITEGGIPENWYWIINMYYPQSGIQVTVYTSEFSDSIEPSSDVGAILLFAPTSIEKRISELFPKINYSDIDWLYTSWKGYGDIEELYRGIMK